MGFLESKEQEEKGDGLPENQEGHKTDPAVCAVTAAGDSRENNIPSTNPSPKPTYPMSPPCHCSQEYPDRRGPADTLSPSLPLSTPHPSCARARDTRDGLMPSKWRQRRTDLSNSGLVLPSSHQRHKSLAVHPLGGKKPYGHGGVKILSQGFKLNLKPK